MKTFMCVFVFVWSSVATTHKMVSQNIDTAYYENIYAVVRMRDFQFIFGFFFGEKSGIKI